MGDVIAAVATGKVPCAIGILRLSGEGCAQRRCAAQKSAFIHDTPKRKECKGFLCAPSVLQ